MRPRGPVPRTAPKSRLACAASRRATGELMTRVPLPAEAAESGSDAARAEANAVPVATCAGVPSVARGEASCALPPRAAGPAADAEPRSTAARADADVA